MAHLILTGATGMVGFGVLDHMLADAAVSKISILSRRPIDFLKDNDKVNVIIHKDYNNYSPELLEQLKGAKGIVWAQGISQNSVKKDEYIKITRDYPVAAAKAFAGLNDNFNFVYVSGEGVSQSPGMFSPLFSKIKGEAETTLVGLSKSYPSLHAYNIRPAMIVPKKTFWETRPQSLLVKLVSPVIAAFGDAYVSPTPHFEKFLTQLALGDGKPLEGKGILPDGRTISNVGFRRLAGI